MLVRIDSELDSADTIVYMAEDGSTLSQVFEHMSLHVGDWEWTIVPTISTARSFGSDPQQIPLIPYSTIVLRPRREANELRRDEPSGSR